MTWKTEEEVDAFDLDVRFIEGTEADTRLATNFSIMVSCGSCGNGTCNTQCGQSTCGCTAATCAGYPDSCGTCGNTHAPCCV